jgi:hypothetical protein
MIPIGGQCFFQGVCQFVSSQTPDTSDFWIPCVFLWRNTVSTHSKENPIYLFLFWELRGLSPNFHIHVSVSDLYIPRIGSHISLQQNGQQVLEIYKSLTAFAFWKGIIHISKGLISSAYKNKLIKKFFTLPTHEICASSNCLEILITRQLEQQRKIFFAQPKLAQLNLRKIWNILKNVLN